MSIPLILAYCSIFASIIALFILIIASFRSSEKKQKKKTNYVKRSNRTIKVDYVEESEPKGTNVRVASLLWTVVLGQVLGLFFALVYVNDPLATRSLLRLNGFILISATLLCSVLTIVNGWFRVKMEVLFRLIFQGYSLLVGGFLLSGAMGKHVSIKSAMEAAGGRLYAIIILFFLTAILALILMFVDVVYRRSENTKYDYNQYFRIVIFVSMSIGLGLLFVKYLLS